MNASQLKIAIDWPMIHLLNDIAAYEREGKMSLAQKGLKDLRGCAMALPGYYAANEGLPYPETDPVELFRELQFHKYSLSQEEVEAFISIGHPNPHEGVAFNLFLFHIPRDVLSIEALSVFTREIGAYLATLREGLVYLRAFPEAYEYHAVHFMGSRRKMNTTDHLEVPAICADGGIKLLSRHRQDPDDMLSHEVYAIVRRGLNRIVL